MGRGVEYYIPTSCNKIILKPTVSDSGRGVRLFERDSGKFIDAKTKDVLSLNLILRESNNLILQEALSQCEFMTKLCSSCVNTIRIAMYRSIVDESPKMLSAVIRIGNAGSIVDNLHQGGRMVRVKECSGELSKYCIDQYGNKYSNHNGIDFSYKTLIVPNWEEIIGFARDVTERVHFARLLQLDVMIDSNLKPRLVEFNCDAFSMWIAQFTGTPALGTYTKEIYDYCRNYMANKTR